MKKSFFIGLIGMGILLTGCSDKVPENDSLSNQNKLHSEVKKAMDDLSVRPTLNHKYTEHNILIDSKKIKNCPDVTNIEMNSLIVQADKKYIKSLNIEIEEDSSTGKVLNKSEYGKLTRNDNLSLGYCKDKNQNINLKVIYNSDEEIK